MVVVTKACYLLNVGMVSFFIRDRSGCNDFGMNIDKIVEQAWQSNKGSKKRTKEFFVEAIVVLFDFRRHD